LPRVVVVGARRARQGIGPFVAEAFARHGAPVCAVVGTTPATATAARDALVERVGGECRAYTELEQALVSERPDIVAICTPVERHREQLEAVACHGAHCLAEKPLWWSTGGDRVRETERLVDRFVERGLRLALVTQWPFVLDTYFALFPQLRDAPVETLEMELGPVSRGPEMVLDSLPHPLSLLDRLLGPGEVDRPEVRFAADFERADVRFARSHARGVTSVRCRLTRHVLPPRPAAIAINGHVARRRIETADYAMFLASAERELPLADPLPLLVGDFLRRVEDRAPTDRRAMIAGIAGLERLVEAAVEASGTASAASTASTASTASAASTASTSSTSRTAPP